MAILQISSAQYSYPSPPGSYSPGSTPSVKDLSSSISTPGLRPGGASSTQYNAPYGINQGNILPSQNSLYKPASSIAPSYNQDGSPYLNPQTYQPSPSIDPSIRPTLSSQLPGGPTLSSALPGGPIGSTIQSTSGRLSPKPYPTIPG